MNKRKKEQKKKKEYKYRGKKSTRLEARSEVLRVVCVERRKTISFSFQSLKTFPQ